MCSEYKISILMALLTFAVAITAPSILISCGGRGGNSVSSNETDEQNASLFDATIYADVHGVSVDEAIRRFRLTDEAGNLDSELSMKEADTFAGLWIEHEPEFKIVVQFTHDGEEIIKQYVTEDIADIIEVREVKVSLVDLELAQRQVISILRNLGVPADSEVDVRENSVKVYVAERSQIDTAIQEGKLSLPDSVEIITVNELAKPE